MSQIVYLSNVRLSFPHIAEPQKQQGPKGERISYNAEFILTRDNPGWAAFHKVVNEMAIAKWGTNAAAVLQMCQGDRKKRCYGAGEEKINGKTFQPYDGYAGMLYISGGRNTMPQIIDPSGAAVDPANTMACQALARKMYGGCYVNAAVKPWLQENEHGRAVRCDLVAVQFFADGTPFGEGAVDASGMFGATPAAAAEVPGFGVVPGAPAAPAWAVPGAPAAAPVMPGVPFPGAVPPAPAGLPSFLS